MEFIYFITSSYPFWAIPLALLFLELARNQKMRGKKKNMKLFALLGTILLAGTGLFFYFGGHKDVDPVFRAIREGKIK